MRDCNKSRDKNLYSTKLVRYLVEIHKGYIRWWEIGWGGQIRLQRKLGSIRWGSQERLLWQSVPRKWRGKVQIPGREAQQSRKGLTQTCCCLIWATGGGTRSDTHWVFSILSVPSMVCFLSAIKATLNWICADPIPTYSCPSNLPPSRDYPTGHPLWLPPPSAI